MKELWRDSRVALLEDDEDSNELWLAFSHHNSTIVVDKDRVIAMLPRGTIAGLAKFIIQEGADA